MVSAFNVAAFVLFVAFVTVPTIVFAFTNAVGAPAMSSAIDSTARIPDLTVSAGITLITNAESKVRIAATLAAAIFVTAVIKDFTVATRVTIVASAFAICASTVLTAFDFFVAAKV